MFTFEGLLKHGQMEKSPETAQKILRLQRTLRQIDVEKEILRTEITNEAGALVNLSYAITEDGLYALARAAVGGSPEVFGEIKNHVLTALTDNRESKQDLTMEFVNRTWLEQEAARDRQNTQTVSQKIMVLGVLFSLGLHEVNPTITHEELYDLLVLKRAEKKDAFIPQFPGSVVERYDEPPYAYLYAQILLSKSQQLTDRVAKMVDRTLVGRKFTKLSWESMHLMSSTYASYLTENKALPVDGQ